MTRKRLWMNRISGIVCLLLWIALVIFLSGTTGKIAGMALGIMLLVAVIYNLYLPKEVSTHLIIPAYAQKEEKITGRLCISNTGVFPVLSEYQGSGTKKWCGCFCYRFGIYGIFGNHDFAGGTVQLFWMYEKGNICKSGEGGNDSATNNGTAFSSTKQRSCLFFF